METVKQKVEALVAYMREAFVRSPWNYANISGYDAAFKEVWFEYVAEMEGMCAGLDGLDGLERLETAKAAEMGARLEGMSKSKCFEVEYDGSGDPYAGYQTYTPKKTPFNLDKYHIMTELCACAELLKNMTTKNMNTKNGMSNARDTTLQAALDKNEVIYHRTRVDFAHTQESMQITQVYDKRTREVLCCEIPWDVASRRTGKDVYSKTDECIMLWPDKSLDLYNQRQMTWIRKICDVGVEFDTVWTEFWEYHGLRGEEGAGGIQFAALAAQMEHMRAMVEKYDAVVAQRWVDGEYETTMPTETARLLYPKIAHARIGTLLRRMKTLA